MLDPLVFEPYYRSQVWGQRRLANLLGKSLPETGSFGESWELSAHPHHISRVLDGPWAGLPLDRLWRSERARIDRQHAPDRFPLLIKLLDCHETLSVQVHPNDEFAATVTPGESGKTEAWFVLAADPGSRIYAGFRAGVTRAEVEHRLQAGTVVECLHQFEPQPGQTIFVPAGTVHAVGGGVLLAEVQQSSDATYRLFDWNRVGWDGRPRDLHIAAALDAIDWDAGPVRPVEPRLLARLDAATVSRLVDCEHFSWNHWEMSAPLRQQGGQMAIWMIVGGRATLRVPATGFQREFGPGQTVLIPAECRQWIWEPQRPLTALSVIPKWRVAMGEQSAPQSDTSSDKIAA